MSRRNRDREEQLIGASDVGDLASVLGDPPEKPKVSKGEVHLPTHGAPRERVDVGVRQVRRPAPGTGERKVRARTAGEASELFESGGEAFERWCVSEKQLDPRIKRPVAEYEALLEEFAARPIHGHRRGPKGGNHRPNRKDLR